MRTILEALEDRIAPAGVVTYTDVDGDLVTVKSSKGTSDDLAAALEFSSDNPDAPRQLREVDLATNPIFADTSLTITSKRTGAGGDGFVNVGAILASGADLGAIKIDGDLGRIVAGDAETTDGSVKSLALVSLGRMGIQTGAGNLSSTLTGGIGKIAIAGDLFEATFFVDGGEDGTIGSLAVGGSIIGIAEGGGAIGAEGAIGKVFIRGDVRGEGEFSGQVISFSTMGKVTVGGSLIGGSGEQSGRIGASGSIGSMVIGGDVIGGFGDESALIGSDAGIGSLIVGGSLIGGDGEKSARIDFAGSAGKVSIGGGLLGGVTFSKIGEESASISIDGDVKSLSIGGSLIGLAADAASIDIGGDVGSLSIGGDLRGATANNLDDNPSASGSAFVTVNGDVSSLKVGGSVVGGFVNIAAAQVGGIHIAGDLGTGVIEGSLLSGTGTGGGGAIQESGSVVVEGTIGKFLVGGSIKGGGDSGIGGTNRNNGIVNAFEIGSLVVKGDVQTETLFFGTKTRINAEAGIGSLTILGSVENAIISVGFDTLAAAANADAQIGKVSVGGNWIASSLAAGVSSTNAIFGDANDVALSGAGVTNDPSIASRISSIVIKGQAMGSTGSLDGFGFVGQQVGSFQVGKTKVPLPDDTLADILIGVTNDLRIHEVA